MYVYLTCILFFQIKKIDEFNLDNGAIFFIVIAGFLRSNYHIEAEIVFKSLVMIINAVLFFVWISRYKNIPPIKYRYFLLSCVLCLLVIPLSAIEKFQIDKYSSSNLIYASGIYQAIGYGIKNILYQLSFVVPIEEVVLRCAFWHLLRTRDFSEYRIALIQGIIFWMMHFSQIGFVFSFFVTLPLVILVETILVKYSKQLFPSLFFHLFINTAIPVLVSVFM
ncbi:MAG: CPBP family glutamic-type intramembrane protease [Anaerolineales bacterium]